MTTDKQTLADADLLARGGGNATAGGVSFQAGVGAIFAVQLLTERNVDSRLRLGTALVRSIRFETEAPLDDILVETDASGWIFVQVKTTLSLSESLDSEFGKTVEQIVRQWRTCVAGAAEREWDRNLVLGHDRMLIAVGSNASGTITGDLSAALVSLQAPSAAALPQAQQQALEKLRAVFALARPAPGVGIGRITQMAMVDAFTDRPGFQQQSDRPAAQSSVRLAPLFDDGKFSRCRGPRHLNLGTESIRFLSKANIF